MMRVRTRVLGVTAVMFATVASLGVWGVSGSAADRSGVHSRGSESGITGHVVIEPTCPVQRPGQSCVQPYQAMIVIRRGLAKRPVARVRSSAKGTFRIALAPGSYLLVPQAGRVHARSSPRTVRVRRDCYTSVVISFDSGIR